MSPSTASPGATLVASFRELGVLREADAGAPAELEAALVVALGQLACAEDKSLRLDASLTPADLQLALQRRFHIYEAGIFGLAELLDVLANEAAASAALPGPGSGAAALERFEAEVRRVVAAQRAVAEAGGSELPTLIEGEDPTRFGRFGEP